MTSKVSLLVALVIVIVGVHSGPTAAHTDSDLVAVAAGSEVTITLKPTHGCGDSPTTEVAIQAPVADAIANEVTGWTASSTPDDSGNTVLEWTGGSLPADATGAFPVTFTAPDTPGTLLTFPSVQVCENGEEMAWISGDPSSDMPAPRLLILPAGSEPAATIDDVPADAPGRDQLTEIVDVDNPQAPAETSPSSTTEPSDTTAATSTTDASAADGSSSTEVPSSTADSSADDAADDDEDSSTTTLLLLGALALVVVAAGAYAFSRRGSQT